MKPWELSTVSNKEEHLIYEWAKLDAADFYFACMNIEISGKTAIYITPRQFFLDHGHMYPESMPISHLMPKAMYEYLPSVFYSDLPIDKVRFSLYKSRFTHSNKFQDFADKTYAEYIKSVQC
jgi:hypothetical protein